MIYNININQFAAVKLGLHKKLKPQDFIIFSFIKDFSSNTKAMKQEFNGDIYYMLNWKLIRNQLPLLGLNSRQAIYNRLKKLEEVGLIEPYSGNQAIRAQYYKFTELSDKLKFYKNEDNERLHQTTNVCTSNNERLHVSNNERLHNNNYNSNNNDNLKEEREKKENSPSKDYEVTESLPTLDPVKNKEEAKKEKVAQKRKADEADNYEELIEVLDLLNDRTGFAAKIPKSYKSVLRYGAYKLVNARMQDYSLDDIKNVLHFKCDEWINDAKMSRYLTYDTLLRKSNFEKYLNQYTISKNRSYEKQQTNSSKRGNESLSIEELFNLIDEGSSESSF